MEDLGNIDAQQKISGGHEEPVTGKKQVEKEKSLEVEPRAYDLAGSLVFKMSLRSEETDTFIDKTESAVNTLNFLRENGIIAQGIFQTEDGGFEIQGVAHSPEAVKLLMQTLEEKGKGLTMGKPAEGDDQKLYILNGLYSIVGSAVIAANRAPDSESSSDILTMYELDLSDDAEVKGKKGTGIKQAFYNGESINWPSQDQVSAIPESVFSKVELARSGEDQEGLALSSIHGSVLKLDVNNLTRDSLKYLREGNLEGLDDYLKKVLKYIEGVRRNVVYKNDLQWMSFEGDSIYIFAPDDESEYGKGAERKERIADAIEDLGGPESTLIEFADVNTRAIRSESGQILAIDDNLPFNKALNNRLEGLHKENVGESSRSVIYIRGLVHDSSELGNAFKKSAEEPSEIK